MGEHDIFTNVNFILYTDGDGDIACKSIRSFSLEAEYEQIQEGGVNEYVHIRKKPVSKPFSIQAERYVGEGFKDPFPIGKELPQLVLKVSSRAGDFSSPTVQFLFHNCIISGKSYNDLDAEKSGMMIETTTITYERMEIESRK